MRKLFNTEYFLISQDKRYRNTPVIGQFFERYYPNLFCPKECSKIPDRNVVYAQSEKKTDFIDILSGPICLVSEAMKRVLEAYDDTICFKMFFVLNTLADQGELYYAPILPEIDCIQPEVKGVDKLMIDLVKAADTCIFRAYGDSFRNKLVINLEVAESLLRREFKGIHYQRLEGK